MVWLWCSSPINVDTVSRSRVHKGWEGERESGGMDGDDALWRPEKRDERKFGERVRGQRESEKQTLIYVLMQRFDHLINGLG